MPEASISKWLFACSKSISECRDFRSSKQELILVQIWVVLILSHMVYALRERIAMTANCDPFEVSIPVLVDLLPRLSSPSALQLDQLVQSGRQLGLLRASPRLGLNVRKAGAFVLPASSTRSTQTTADPCLNGSQEASA